MIDDDTLRALPRTRASRSWDRLWRPFWAVPLAIVVTAVVAGYAVPVLDRSLGGHLPYVFPGGPSAARNMLGTVAGAMISVTGLVFSITMVVVQLASSQYSPRLLSDFLGNRVAQATLGVFAASFTYSLTVLRSVRGENGEGAAFVPQLGVTLAFLLVLLSMGMFIAFIHHITKAIQVSTILSDLGDATVGVVDRYLPEPGVPGARLGAQHWQPDPSVQGQQVRAHEHGAVVEVDYRELVSWAVEHDAVVEVVPRVGDFVPERAPTLRVWRRHDAPPLDERAVEHLNRQVRLGTERWFTQDPAYGIRKLVDVAERALSPAINDPTTSVQALDELHRILRLTVVRADLPAIVRQDGEERLVHRPQRVEELIDLALAEPLHYGADSVQVPPRVVSMLEDLVDVALPEHRPRLEGWLTVARRAAEQVRLGET